MRKLLPSRPDTSGSRAPERGAAQGDGTWPAAVLCFRSQRGSPGYSSCEPRLDLLEARAAVACRPLDESPTACLSTPSGARVTTTDSRTHPDLDPDSHGQPWAELARPAQARAAARRTDSVPSLGPG
jgi:hypothetical protein